MKTRNAVYAAVALIIACLIVCMGFFLSGNNKNKAPNREASPEIEDRDIATARNEASTGGTSITATPETSGDSMDQPFREKVVHKELRVEIGGCEQVINILEVSLGQAEVKPVLSFNLIYGFEKLSDMAAREGAYAAVNGGFFHEYGEPSGMVLADGKMYTLPTGQYPVLLLYGNTAEIIRFECKMSIVSGDGSIRVDALNTWESPSAAIVYTPVYGTTNRAKGENITVRIRNNTVESIETVNGESDIPRDGMLVTFYPPYKYEYDDLPLQPGNRVRVEYSPSPEGLVHAYECGAWLVKDGENIAPKSDGWVGILTGRDPRTAVGVKDEGKTVVLVTVDGRQPGYSAGLTAQELADFLIQTGVEDAAMLDGGASTEMIVNGEIVNRPSIGQERKMAGGLMVFNPGLDH